MEKYKTTSIQKDKTTRVQRDKTTSIPKDKTTSIGCSSLIIRCWLMVVLATLSFSSCDSSSRRAEQLRLERACTIDTTLSTHVNIDTIDGYASLARLTAESWIMVDDSSGMMLSARDADRRMYPASLTKMMTCLIALEHGNLSDTIVITPDIFVTTDAMVRPGYQFTLRNLMVEMM